MSLNTPIAWTCLTCDWYERGLLKNKEALRVLARNHREKTGHTVIQSPVKNQRIKYKEDPGRSV